MSDTTKPGDIHGHPIVECTDDLIELVATHDAEVRAQALNEAADELDLPGSTATGYYASEQDSGYRDAERDAKQWLRARANRIEREATSE